VSSKNELLHPGRAWNLGQEGARTPIRDYRKVVRISIVDSSVEDSQEVRLMQDRRLSHSLGDPDSRIAEKGRTSGGQPHASLQVRRKQVGCALV
jgi:hypothetical protein